MLVGVGEIVLALILTQLLVDLILPVCGEVDVRKCIGNLLYLVVCQVFENVNTGGSVLSM